MERFEITLFYSAGNKHLCTCWKMHLYLCKPCIYLHNTVLSHSPREHHETFISHPSFCFCLYSSYFILTSNLLCYSPFSFPRESLTFPSKKYSLNHEKPLTDPVHCYIVWSISPIDAQLFESITSVKLNCSLSVLN